MGRKRLEKKALQRLESLERQLEALSRRGADGEFLELVHRSGPAPLSPAAAGLYSEVMDRTLRRALAGGDLAAVERLLRQVRREAAARPWVRLAEAVTQLGEGRLDAALAGLAALPDPSPIPPKLTAALTAFCSPSPEPALDRLYRSLAGLGERGFHPEAVEAAGLEEDLGILRAALSADPAAKKLLDATQACLLRLRDLADLEKALREEEGSAGLHQLFLEGVRRLSGPLLEVFRDGPAAALIQPLRHAVRLRWRTILSLMIERGDDAVWAAALAESPALLVLDLEIEGGRVDGPARLANRQVARDLLAAGRHQELARRLAAWGRSEPVPERLARLWSLELWAWERAASGSDAEDEVLRAFSDPEMHDVLLRLAAMAGEIEQRFPAEHRPAVARFLRTQLFDLFEAVCFCDHFLDAAGALLRHLPDDPGLLAVAVTAAVCTEDFRAITLFASRIEARKGAPDVEAEPLLRLIPQLAHEPPRHAARILPLLRPLLSEEDWPRAVSAFAQRVTNLTCSSLRRDESEYWVRDVLQDLAVYRAALPESGVLAALEAAVRCLLRSGKPEDLRQVLERTPGLAPALAALRALTASAPAHQDLWPSRAALQEARETVIERLDANWRLWRPLLPSLVVGAGKGTVRKLRNRLQGILRRKALGDVDRQAIESALEEIRMLQTLSVEKLFGLPTASRKKTADPDTEETKRAPRAKKPRRRRASDELQPELF